VSGDARVSDLWVGMVVFAFGVCMSAFGAAFGEQRTIRALDRDHRALVACEARAAACGAERAVCLVANRDGAAAVHQVIRQARDCAELRDVLLRLRVTDAP
jgi:hypothetical protein